MRVTDETKVTDGRTGGRTNGRKDGTYSAGVKDSASAYVLCPRLTEQLCLSIWKGIGNCRRGLRRISREMGVGKECGKTERWDFTKLVYKLKLTTKACRNLYISEQ